MDSRASIAAVIAVVVVVCLLYVVCMLYLTIRAIVSYDLARGAEVERAREDAWKPRAGDVVAFSASNSSLLTRIVCGWNGTAYFHVGVVVELDVGQGQGQPYLMHYVDPSHQAFYQPMYACSDVDDLCLSDLRALCGRYQRGSLVAVHRPKLSLSLTSTDILSAALRVAKGLPYDVNYTMSYAASIALRVIGRQHRPAALNCNTFVGLLCEELSLLERRSQYPARDYVPGKLQLALMSSGNFRHVETYFV
jgi:hypothetical protein